MSCLIGKFNLILMVALVALVGVACGPAEGPAPAKEDIAADSIAVPEATPTEMVASEAMPTETATSSPEVQPAPPATPTTELPTEIIEPVSPISPATTVETAMENSTSRSIAPVPGSDAAVAAAIADLVKQKNLQADEITVKTVETMEWPDTGLGCPQEGFMYAQVITPGYLITLEAQGQTYEYHTDEQGQSVILCEK